MGSAGSPVLMLADDQQQQEDDTTVVDSWSDRPDTATLTKGFSIPTYLPPFPEFIPADLPHLLRNASSGGTPLTEDNGPSGNPMPSKPNEQSRLHAYDSEQKAQQLRREKELAKERELLPRRQLSLPPLNATVQAGQHAYLPCKLNQHSGKPLSWVRLRDEHIIAVDHTTFINDARFGSLLQSSTSVTLASGGVLSTTSTPSAVLGNSSAHASPGGQERGNSSSLSWTLQIKYVRLEDAGWYECQLATEPKMSAKVQLFVITPRTELIGDRQRFVKAGSRVELHCIVRGTLEAPKYIFWYRGDQQVTAENEASGTQSGWYTQIDRNIFGSTEHNRNTIGSLVIPLVRKIHSGNYTCEPENSAAASMQLHVLSGEYSASAIKSTAAGPHRLGHGYTSLHQWLIFLLVALNKT
uniref:GG12638 n=2 Tax=Drosophila erecta TaxID=7220 RepID=B3P295_DROER